MGIMLFIFLNDSLISIFALVVALYSVFYTHYFNRRHIRVSLDDVSFDSEYPLYYFSVNNISQVSVNLTDIRFSLPTGETITPINFIPEDDGLSILECSDELKSGSFRLVYPNTGEQFAYFFDKRYEHLIVTVVTAEPIHHFKRHQSFFIDFV